jgi:hypothetical protein
MILCYQAYGRIDVINQTLFSVVSLLRFFDGPAPLRVVIYTDMRALLEKFFAGDKRVELIEITAADLQRWRGEINFVHRVKLEVLQDCARRYRGSLFYCDGDTYFLSDPLSLFEVVNDGTSLMHIAETVIATSRDPLAKKIAKFLRGNEFAVSGKIVRVPPTTVMWNAGVIGISEKNCGWLGEMIGLTDAMYSKYKKHVMEQLAVSYYLQRESKVLPTDSVIYHYWDQKPEYQVAIDEFLAQYSTLVEAVANYSRFQWPEAPKPKPAKKNFIEFLFG